LIESAISHIAAQLNQALRRNLGLTEDAVEVASLMDLDGTVVPGINNRLLVFLVNIERDGTLSGKANEGALLGGARSQGYPPVHLNLHVMVAAHFPGKNHKEALKFISAAIAYFQGNPVFTPQNSPDLDARLQRLTMDIENLTLQDLSHLWGVLGGKYLPSVLYKVRMVTLDSGDLARITPAVREADAGLRTGG